MSNDTLSLWHNSVTLIYCLIVVKGLQQCKWHVTLLSSLYHLHNLIDFNYHLWPQARQWYRAGWAYIIYTLVSYTGSDTSVNRAALCLSTICFQALCRSCWQHAAQRTPSCLSRGCAHHLHRPNATLSQTAGFTLIRSTLFLLVTVAALLRRYAVLCFIEQLWHVVFWDRSGSLTLPHQTHVPCCTALNLQRTW